MFLKALLIKSVKPRGCDEEGFETYNGEVLWIVQMELRVVLSLIFTARLFEEGERERVRGGWVEKKRGKDRWVGWERERERES